MTINCLLREPLHLILSTCLSKLTGPGGSLVLLKIGPHESSQRLDSHQSLPRVALPMLITIQGGFTALRIFAYPQTIPCIRGSLPNSSGRVQMWPHRAFCSGLWLSLERDEAQRQPASGISQVTRIHSRRHPSIAPWHTALGVLYKSSLEALRSGYHEARQRKLSGVILLNSLAKLRLWSRREREYVVLG